MEQGKCLRSGESLFNERCGYCNENRGNNAIEQLMAKEGGGTARNVGQQRRKKPKVKEMPSVEKETTSARKTILPLSSTITA